MEFDFQKWISANVSGTSRWWVPCSLITLNGKCIDGGLQGEREINIGGAQDTGIFNIAKMIGLVGTLLSSYFA